MSLSSQNVYPSDTLQESEDNKNRTIDICQPMDTNASIEVTTPLADSFSHVPHGDSFFADFFSPQQHLALLKERGLGFKNRDEEERLERLIATIGYYKLSQYFRHFYVHPNDKTFQAGTTGKQIMTAYRQNERLRSVLIDACPESLHIRLYRPLLEVEEDME